MMHETEKQRGLLLRQLRQHLQDGGGHVPGDEEAAVPTNVW